LPQRDAAVVERDVQIASLTAELGRITSSRSWKVTMPLRFVGRVLQGDWAAVQASIVSLRNAKKNLFVTEEETSANKDVIWKDEASTLLNKQNMSLEQPPLRGKRILLVSYYCPSRAHAGGLRILDIYSLIKSEFPFIGLDLYTYRRPEVDWSYDGLESIFDNIYYSDTEELSVKGLLNQCKECPRYTVIDLQFHHSARYIDAFRALGGKILFTPIESLARSFFIDVKEALYNAHRLPLKDIVAGVRNTIKELKYCLKADEAICVSKADATYLRAISWSRKIKYLESGVSDIEFKHELSESSLVLNPRKKENIIIYVAFFGSKTNILAMKWYLDKVHPLIKKKVPDYMLHVVGRGDLSVFAGYQDEAVILVGAVPSLGHYINEAKVGIVPALGGAGLRGKMSQYAIFGVPCVASPIAVKGSAYKDGVDIYITEVPEIFAAHCITLLTNEEINKRIGETARQTVLQNYTWKSKMDIIRKIYALGDI
jgi:glycosyltransferase involved in cell wall biosynthesis